MAYPGARLPQVAIHRVCFTMPPAAATPLHERKTSQEDAKCLARLAHRHTRLSHDVATAGRDERHCRARAA